MNVILLTAIIFTVAHGGQGGFSNGNHMISNWAASPMIQPCQQKSNISRYDTFVERHILIEDFDKNNPEEWASYLRRSNLCGREPVQSFIDNSEEEVQQICGGAGRRVKGAIGQKGNLCISDKLMTVYDVESDNNCNVFRAPRFKKRVTVACNKTYDNRCLPVHYEGGNNQRGNRPCM